MTNDDTYCIYVAGSLTLPSLVGRSPEQICRLWAGLWVRSLPPESPITNCSLVLYIISISLCHFSNLAFCHQMQAQSTASRRHCCLRCKVRLHKGAKNASVEYLVVHQQSLATSLPPLRSSFQRWVPLLNLWHRGKDCRQASSLNVKSLLPLGWYIFCSFTE